jgi:hypothetical protein
MTPVFLDGTDERAAELRRILPGFAFELASLPVGYATAAPDPSSRARDMVLAAEHDGPCFAEATDLMTAEGKSLRLELDSENDNRFCRWFRETPARLVVCVALRRAPGADVELFGAECEGKIADAPAGARAFGWDRMFVPDGFRHTLAELAANPKLGAPKGDDPDPVGLRTMLYGDLAAALATAT